MRKKGNRLFHYTNCGLDYIYLANGYELYETPEGRGYSIQNVEGLHNLIAKIIVTSPDALRGQELRFLRARLRLSQAGIAGLLQTTAQTIKRWEKKRCEHLPGPADSALRQFYALKRLGNKVALEICDLLAEIDELEHGKQYQAEQLETDDGQWRKKKAA